MLVDADEVASSTAPRLGLAIEPNLRSAIDAVEHGLGDLATPLVRRRVQRSTCLCGLPSLAAAAQIRPAEVLDVIDAARRPAVARASSRSRASPGIEIARAVVAEAGVLVGVGAANPVGVARLLGWVAALLGRWCARAPRGEPRPDRSLPARRARRRDLAHVHAGEPHVRPDRPSRRSTRRGRATARSAWPVHARRGCARARCRSACVSAASGRERAGDVRQDAFAVGGQCGPEQHAGAACRTGSQ